MEKHQAVLEAGLDMSRVDSMERFIYADFAVNRTIAPQARRMMKQLSDLFAGPFGAILDVIVEEVNINLVTRRPKGIFRRSSLVIELTVPLKRPLDSHERDLVTLSLHDIFPLSPLWGVKTLSIFNG